MIFIQLVLDFVIQKTVILIQPKAAKASTLAAAKEAKAVAAAKEAGRGLVGFLSA